MTEPNYSIVAEGIAKQYQIGAAELRYDSFREMLTAVLANPFKRFKTLSGTNNDDNSLWALKDINFKAEPGEIIGVIGHNGAGKSTLLKVLSRITTPTQGMIKIRGKVASLLEVGTGFHPELTGRENIYLNGSILGMTRLEIDSKFDEIATFAEIEQFLDTPVKRYSSGMYVRLAFAVAASLDSQVLIVDEVLAVGDQNFQAKCLGKLGDVSEQGRTVLFVSHNLSMVSKLCERVIVMNHGCIVYDGSVHEAISVYNAQMSSLPVLSNDEYSGNLFPDVKFKLIEVNDREFVDAIEVDPSHSTIVKVRGVSVNNIDLYRNVLCIYKDGQLLFSIHDSSKPSVLSFGEFESVFEIPRYFLVPGEHTFSLGGINYVQNRWLWTRAYRFSVAHRWAECYDTTSNELGLVNLETFGTRKSV